MDPVDRCCGLAGAAVIGQLFDRFGYAEALFDPPWSVTKESFDVLRKAGEAEVLVHTGSKCAYEPSAFFPVEVRAALGDPGELVMRVLPIEMVHVIH